MAKGSDDGDEGDGDEVAKAAMQVATPTNPNPTRVWSGGFSRQSCRVALAVAELVGRVVGEDDELHNCPLGGKRHA